MIRSRLTASLFGLPMFVALAGTACQDDPHRGWDSDISFPEAQALLERGPRRLDVELPSTNAGPTTAHRLEVEEDDELLDDEVIEAELLSFATLEDAGACRGTLTLAVPGVEVHFDSAVTRFGGLDDAPGCTAFVEYVQTRLAEGHRLRVEARRRPARTPQDRADTLFFADALILSDDDAGDGKSRLELNVTPSNLRSCAVAETPSDCVGALELFGASVIAQRDVTEIEAEDPTELLLFDLDERVMRVDAAQGALLLADGRVLRVLDGTQIDDDGVANVDDVEARLMAGERVVVEGEAVLSASAPTSLLGIELALHSAPFDEDDEDIEEPRAIVLHDQVVDVDPASGVILLPFATDLMVDTMTRIEGDFDDLAALDQAIGAGLNVRAEALGVTEATSPRHIVRADRVTLRSAAQA